MKYQIIIGPIAQVIKEVNNPMMAKIIALEKHKTLDFYTEIIVHNHNETVFKITI